LLAILKGSTKLLADETAAPVLDPGRGRTKIGQLSAYARDDRSLGGQTARPSANHSSRRLRRRAAGRRLRWVKNA
jgi:hypothetical protein